MGSFPTEKHTEMQEILENRIIWPKMHSEQNTMVILSLLQSKRQKGKLCEKSTQDTKHVGLKSKELST